MTAAAPSPSLDPTAVVGRRFGAAAIDLGILWVFSVTYWFMASEELPPFVADLIDPCTGRALCTNVNDRYVEGWPLVLLGAVWALYFIGVFVLQRGVTGRTVGTMLTGVVVVGPDGRPLGPGRALLRSVAGLVDYLPCCLPIVGVVTVLASPGHRRVGDMAADSYVVDNERFGHRVELPGPAQPASTPPPMPDGYPAQPPIPPAAQPPAPPAAPMWAAPHPAPGTTWPAPPTTSTSPPSPASEAVWDPERQAYLQWDPARGEWLQFDAATQRWQHYDAAEGRWRPIGG